MNTHCHVEHMVPGSIKPGIKWWREREKKEREINENVIMRKNGVDEDDL